jgi:predicted PurR-regulated permease PerM
MTVANAADPDLEKRISGRLLDVLIRFGLIVTLVVLCFKIFAPFVSLMVWALILAVALYPFIRDGSPAGR